MHAQENKWGLTNPMAKMSPVEFAAAAAVLHMDERAEEAARRVLVVGEKPTEVANALELSRQMVSHWTGRVKKAREAQVAALAGASPPGWVAGILALPADEMKHAENRSKAALYTLSLQCKE